MQNYNTWQVLQAEIITNPLILHYVAGTDTIVGRSHVDAAAAAFHRALPSLTERQRQTLIDNIFQHDDQPSRQFIEVIANLASGFFSIEPYGVRMKRNAVIPWLEYFGAKLTPQPLMGALLVSHVRQGNIDRQRACKLLNAGSVPPPSGVDVSWRAASGRTAPCLNDNHMHASNLASPSLLWSQALANPIRWVIRLQSGLRENAKFRRLLSYFMPDTTIHQFTALMQLASWFRSHLVELVLGTVEGQLDNGVRILRAIICGERTSIQELETSSLPISRRHPCEHLEGGSQLPASACEALWWLDALTLLGRREDSDLRRLLHAYHLIYSLFVKIVVQQHNVRGFDLFEAYASSPVRDTLENDVRRMRLESLRDLLRASPLKHAELRIAPKTEGSAFLTRKVLPLSQALRSISTEIQSRSGESARQFEGTIAVHFIKREDKDRRAGRLIVARHTRLRMQLVFEMHAIHHARRRRESLITAIDAANSEYHARPEVFAPIFREISEREKLGLDGRRSGQHPLRMTFHAGEEFYHPLSGLRAVAEVLEFLGLPIGSRIGHGMVLGVDFEKWCQQNLTAHVPRLEWLDNLVWLASVVDVSGRLARWCRDQVAIISRRIYGRPIELAILHEAWELRELPVTRIEHRCLNVWKTRWNELAHGDLTEGSWRDPKSWQYGSSDKVFQIQQDPFSVFREYHFSPSVLAHGDEIERIEFRDQWQRTAFAEAMEAAATGLLSQLGERRIALECCPTSNTRITQEDKWKTHPLFKLAPPDGPSPATNLMICTDNPGMCQTTPALEHIAAQIIAEEIQGEKGATDQWLDGLIHSSDHLGFRSAIVAEEMPQNVRRIEIL